MSFLDKYRLPLFEGEGAGSGGAAAGSAGSTSGGGANPWHHGIDAGIMGHWQNKGYDLSDPGKVAVEATKAAMHAQSLLGVPKEQIVRLPADANDEAGWRGVYSRLGVPADAKEYDLAGIKFANGDEIEAGFSDTMRAALHKARVTKEMAPEVVKAVVKFMDDADSAEATARTAKIETERAALKRDWGQNFDLNRLHAMEGAKRLGVSPETVAQLEQQVGYAQVMEMFRRVGAGTREDTFVEGARTRPDGLPATMAGAKQMLAEKQADPAWVQRLFAKDPTTLREFQNLTKLATGLTDEAA